MDIIIGFLNIHNNVTEYISFIRYDKNIQQRSCLLANSDYLMYINVIQTVQVCIKYPLPYIRIASGSVQR